MTPINAHTSPNLFRHIRIIQNGPVSWFCFSRSLLLFLFFCWNVVVFSFVSIVWWRSTSCWKMTGAHAQKSSPALSTCAAAGLRTRWQIGQSTMPDLFQNCLGAGSYMADCCVTKFPWKAIFPVTYINTTELLVHSKEIFEVLAHQVKLHAHLLKVICYYCNCFVGHSLLSTFHGVPNNDGWKGKDHTFFSNQLSKSQHNGKSQQSAQSDESQTVKSRTATSYFRNAVLIFPTMFSHTELCFVCYFQLPQSINLHMSMDRTLKYQILIIQDAYTCFRGLQCECTMFFSLRHHNFALLFSQELVFHTLCDHSGRHERREVFLDEGRSDRSGFRLT